MAVEVVSLGCPKALVDSEHIVTGLANLGYEVTVDDANTDVVVINTCGFIEAAKAESIESIATAFDQGRKVVVTGCMGKDQTELRSVFPQLEFISGPNDTAAVLGAVQQYAPPTEQPWDVDHVRMTPAHYAYLKISEGCNHTCSFCIIPTMRGKLQSRSIDDVLREAERLAADGVQEILLIAQDLSAYGADLRYREGIWKSQALPSDLYHLCAKIGELLPWVRLHYVYPYPQVKQLLPLMKAGQVLPYLDMPLQHAAPNVLKAMRRPAASAKTLQRIQDWRQEVPELAIRSTFIVGFPGETDADFATLLDFLEAAQLDRAGCFTYSAVQGAAANALPGAISEREKLDRQETFYEVQSRISETRLQRHVGTRLRVLIDTVHPEGGVGRTQYDAPEIDGVVHVASTVPLRAGEFIWVAIESSNDHDLHGIAVGENLQLKN